MAKTRTKDGRQSRRMGKLISDNSGMVPSALARDTAWIKPAQKKLVLSTKKQPGRSRPRPGCVGDAAAGFPTPHHRGFTRSAHLACESLMAAIRPGPWQTRQVSVVPVPWLRGA
jgi:hypothetical protein